MKPWWAQDAYCGWLEYEVKLLQALHGVQVGDVTKHDDGRVTIHLTYDYKGEAIAMKVVFPAQYPHFPPTIETPGRKMYRHRGQTTEQMCFLGHNVMGDHEWVPLGDSAAKMLEKQVPEALRISELVREGKLTPEEVEGKEVSVGEALSFYLADQQLGGIFMNDYEVPPAATHGIFTWALLNMGGNAQAPFIRGALDKPVEQNRTKLRYQPTSWLPRLHPHAQRKKADWIKVSLPDTLSGQQVWPWLHENHPQLATKVVDTAIREGIGLVGLVLEEEIRHLENGTSWIFLAAARINGELVTIVLPALRVSDKEMSLRVPELLPLRNKIVLIIGLGSIGAPVALQLAKSGVGRLRLVDKDFVKPGNIVRWPVGLEGVGQHKAYLLSGLINNNYPGVQSLPEHMAIGGATITLKEVEALHEWIQNSDIVIDGTASFEANEYLSGICSQLKRPYIWLSTTEGAWGGIIGRLLHQEQRGCFMEYCRRLNADIQKPFLKPNDSVVPAGCVTSTFTGIGIDCEQVGLFAARLAVSTLCSDQQDAYPDFDWDVAVFNFRSQDGTKAVAPVWTTYSLACPSDCTYRNKGRDCGGE